MATTSSSPSGGPTCSDLPSLVSSFADAFVDFAVSGLFFPTPPPPNPNPNPATFLPTPSRLVAVGDLHGDLPKSLAAFRLAGIVAGDRWSGGSAVAVQVGDVLDRGGDELRLLYLLRRLQLGAAAAGGALVAILGNHEVMNVAGDFRFATPAGLADFSAWAAWFRAGLAMKRRCPGLEQPRNPFLGVPRSFPGVKPEFWDGIRSRVAALRPAGPITTRFLADKPTVAVVGDSVFVHGGLLEGHVEYGLERINAEVREWMLGEGGGNAGAPAFVRGRDAVVWLRRFSEGAECDCGRLQAVLGMIPGGGAKRMVMGHTIQAEGITAACGARALRVDVGLSRGCGDGRPEVLEINGGGAEVRVLTANPAYDWRHRKREAEKAEAAGRGQVKDGLALLVRESHGLKEVEA